jgi:hypothetical protein
MQRAALRSVRRSHGPLSFVRHLLHAQLADLMDLLSVLNQLATMRMLCRSATRGSAHLALDETRPVWS